MNPEPTDPCAALCPPPASIDDLPEGEFDDRELALLAKAIGHPTRVRILRLLAEREACVCGELVDELPLAQSTVSQHLKILKDAGLIRGEIAASAGLLLHRAARPAAAQGAVGLAVSSHLAFDGHHPER